VAVFSDRASRRVGKPPSPRMGDRALKKQLVAVFSDRASRRVGKPPSPRRGNKKAKG